MRALRLLPFIILPLVAACNSGSSTSASASTTGETKTAEAAGGDFKVALLTPGPVSDSGWNAMAYDGLYAIKTEMGAQVDNQQASGTQIRDSLRSYAQKKYNLVFGHGFEYNEPAIEVAKDFPDTVFVTSSGGKTAPNVGAFRFALEEGFYVAGMMAALVSKTGKVGSVSLGGIPSIDSTLDAYEAGAKAAKADIVTVRARIQTDGDVAAAKQATAQLAESGVDVVIHQANSSAQGVFEAAKEKGIYAIGSNQNQNENPSGAVVASAYIIAKPAFLKLAQEVKDKKFTGRIVLMGMKDNAIEFALNRKFAETLPAPLQQRLSDTTVSIKQGTIKVPMAKF